MGSDTNFIYKNGVFLLQNIIKLFANVLTISKVSVQILGIK